MTYGGKVFKTKTASNAGGNAVFDEIAEFQRDPKVNKLQVCAGPVQCGSQGTPLKRLREPL